MAFPVVAAALASLTLGFFAQLASNRPPACQAEGGVVGIPQVPEASGLAASLRVPGRLWTHKDSGEPVLFALDARGAVTGRVTIPGAKMEDWEAVAVGQCPAGSCVYIADIGDNDARRKSIVIYRVAEPGDRLESPAAADVFRAAYPDGPQDAETLLVTPDGRLFVVTKGSTGPVALYGFPRELRAGAIMTLERIGQPIESKKPEERDRITDGAVSPDGRWVVLRTHASLRFFRASDLLSGKWREASNIDLRRLGEPQGEGVAFGSGGAMYLIGEGGGKGQPGTFVRLTCQ
jgi:hypothetical protein